MAARVVALGICGLVVRWRTRAAASDRGRRGCRLRTAAALPPHLYCTHAPPGRRERLHDEVRRGEECDKEDVLDAADHSWDGATITPLRVYRLDVSAILRSFFGCAQVRTPGPGTWTPRGQGRARRTSSAALWRLGENDGECPSARRSASTGP